MSLNKEPTYIDCINYGEIPLCLLDIAIIYKGYIKYGFLVSHNNNIIKKKLYNNINNIDIYEISVDNFLQLQNKKLSIDIFLNYCNKIL
jgi:hypothetical protein